MKAKLPAIIVAILVAGFLAAASGCQYIMPKEEDPLPPPLDDPKDIDYQTVEVVRGDVVQSVQGAAHVESFSMADVYSADGGRLKNVAAKVGDTVRKGDVLAQLDTDDLEFNLDLEKLKLQEMQNNYDLLKKQMRNATELTPLKNAEIELEIEQKIVERMESKVDAASLRSPIDGSVVFVADISQGGMVDAYKTVVRIADQNSKVLVYEDEANRSSLQVGMKVQLTLASGGPAAEGTVISSPFARGALDSGALANSVFIGAPDAFLKNAKIGDEVKVILILAERDGVLKLPRNAVKTYQQRRYVEVLVDNVKVEKDVQVGLETTTETEITAGLSQGDKVVVD